MDIIGTRSMRSYLAQVGKSWVFNPTERPFLEQDQNILFIGNSYTGYNQVAELVKYALETGVPDYTNHVHVESHTPPYETFAGHWKGLEKGDTFSPFSFDYYYRSHHLQRWLLPNNSVNTDKINRHWKWITLQNHSVQAGFCKSPDGTKQKAIFDESLQAAKKIHNVIMEHYPSSNTLFILTWGRLGRESSNPDLYTDYLTMQQLLFEGYQRYVAETSTAKRPTYIAPVGLVFRTIYNDLVAAGNDDPTQPGNIFYDLYDQGDHHPSLAGSYVYALTVYATLTGRDVVDDLEEWVPAGLDLEVARTLRDAVRRTIQETVETMAIRYPWQSEQQQSTLK